MRSLKERFEYLQTHVRRIDQAELARRVEVKPPSVAAWFNGDTQDLKAKTAINIADVYGVNVRWLVTGEGCIRVDGVSATSSEQLHRPAMNRDNLRLAPVLDWSRLTANILLTVNSELPTCQVPAGYKRVS